MKNVIITGADGFVGSHTTDYFLRRGCHVLALGRQEKPLRLRPHKNLTWMQWDVFHPETLLEKIPIGFYDTFLHFAWDGSAGEARKDAALQLKNAYASGECVKLAKKLGCTRFVGAGSIMEYEVEAAVHGQGTRPGLGYVYGLGKQAAHGLCKAVAADAGIDFVWCSITNAYGIGEVSPRFVNTTLRKLLRGEPLEFTAATQNYDFVYVTDAARAIGLAAEHGRPFREYIIGSGGARPLREFIRELAAACAPDAVLRFGDIPFTGVDLPLSAFDITPLTLDCGFAPEISFGQGTRMTMDWLKEQER